MTNRSPIHNKIGLLGAVVGSAGLLLPTLTLKANRVDSGVVYRVWEISPIAPALLVITGVLLALTVALCCMQDSTVSALSALLYTIIGALVVAVAVSLLVLSQHLIVSTETAARVSPASGFWLLMTSAYILMRESGDTTTHTHTTARTPRPQWGHLVRIAVLVGVVVVVATGELRHLAIVQEFRNNRSRFFQDLFNHIFLSTTAVSLAIVIGIPLGIVAWRRKLLERGVFAVVNSIQTIPSLALFGLIITPLSLFSFRFPWLRSLGIKGVGNAPALIALTLYALLPIVQNTYTSLANIRRAVIDAGWGMGMNARQMLTQVEIPLALPILMSGVRTSLVQTIGNTTIAALIGAAGLGAFIFRGLGQAAPDLVYLGVVPVIIMAVVADRFFGVIIKKISLPVVHRGVL